ncbi:hypothetical protein TSUD_08640 [Trifolium subterraneum]|nr:hypothetical protein TSUD_08640 [Trifolium subterraneum]
MAVWLNTVHDSDREAFFSADFQQWFDMNLQVNVKGVDVNNWQSYWAIACHALWTWRNKEEHNDMCTRPFNPHMHIMKLMTDYAMVEQVNYNVVPVTRVMGQVGWCPPN